ncbi:hypothetical protein H5968_01050 [Sphaerospermopsis sp. LEGE 00249]|uniref:hypothetical protein n=1 Tax=Sphaerospermopsis sp. LEGE 00249 TaxID=1380707 RepID=UPI00164E3BF8|nr:hypothetical protein [Sphaerospermopsis sp. LEGE 00249]MBC5793774.1 hypothetical protein [Sphaerospermopsis sp. LEGE 00249]
MNLQQFYQWHKDTFCFDSCTGEVGAKHSENNLFRKLIICRPNASPLQENRLGEKFIISRPNASPLTLLTPDF